MSKVVIIGGGPSAKHMAEILKKAKDIQVTVIQANRFVEWAIAMPHVLCNPARHNDALSANPKKYELPGVNYVYGPATKVDLDSKTVSVQQDGGTGSTPVSFDALIVCTGLDLPVFSPALGVTVADRKAEVEKIHGAVAAAGTVAVLGGGIIGVEFAGTVRSTFPGKEVVVLCRDGILKQFSDKKRDKVSDVLKDQNIRVVVGDMKDVPQELQLETGTAQVGDQSVAYDVLVPSFSRGPGTKFLAGTGLLDDLGYIKVNEFLQSETSKDVFAVGVSNAKASFVGLAKLEGQWKDASKNVLAHLHNKPLRAHNEAVPFMKTPPAVMVSLGKGGWASFDFSQLPAPLKCCCCNGLGGFPFCPPPCCWCLCGPCCCGYCGGAPEGEGTARAMAAMPFKSFGFHFKGVADVPAQQTMK